MKGLPLKRPVDATANHLSKALNAFIKAFSEERGIPSDAVTRLNSQISNLSSARQSLLRVATSGALLEGLNQYYSMLTAVLSSPLIIFGKTGHKSGQYSKKSGKCEVIFSWNEAFNLEKTVANFDVEFEKASLIFCIATAYSNLAAEEAAGTADSFKQRAVHCLKSAGVFQYLQDSSAVAVNSWGSLDLSADVLSSMKELMIAEAAGATFLNVLSQGKSAKALKQVAAGAADRFEIAERSFNSNGSKAYLQYSKTPFKEYCKFCSGYFRAEAQFAASQESIAAQKYGEEIARLRYAAKLLDSIKGKYQVEYLSQNIQNLAKKIKSRLPAAEKDNDSIYIEKIPDISTLGDLEARVLGKPASFEPPATDSTMFASLETLKNIPKEEKKAEDPFQTALSQLKELGYSQADAASALKSNKNDFTLALEFLSTKVSEKDAADKATPGEKGDSKDSKGSGQSGGILGLFGYSKSFVVDEEMVQQFVELGFPEDQARLALKDSKNDFTKALDSLSQRQDSVADQPALGSKGESKQSPEAMLLAMGFPLDDVKKSLVKSRNDFNGALEILSSAGSSEIKNEPSGPLTNAVNDSENVDSIPQTQLASAPSEELPSYLKEDFKPIEAKLDTPPLPRLSENSGAEKPVGLTKPEATHVKTKTGSGFFGMFKRSHAKVEESEKWGDQKNQLIGLGFETSKVDAALAEYGGDFEKALDKLTKDSEKPSPVPQPAAQSLSGASKSNSSDKIKQLTLMGYSEKQAEAALLLANDDLAQAVKLLSKQSPPGDSTHFDVPVSGRAPQLMTPELKTLIEMGFSEEASRKALIESNNNVDQALAKLM